MSAMQFVTIHDITLHYKREGLAEGVPLVFIHSLGCDLRIWDGVVPPLAPYVGVIRYDKRGHGLSDVSPAPYAMRDLAADIEGLLNHLNIESAILVGLSVGGLTAMQFALNYPHRLKALILCDTAAKIGTAESWGERIHAIRARGMKRMARIILPRWFAPDFAERYPALYRGFYTMLTRMPVDGYLAACAALAAADLRGEVSMISVPALVLCGALDTASPPDMVRGLADALPEAHFELIEGAGHTIPVEQPEATAAAILRFLKEQKYV